MRDHTTKQVQGMSDELLVELLSHPHFRKILHDWRNWGDNPQRLMAEETHRRGLLKEEGLR